LEHEPRSRQKHDDGKSCAFVVSQNGLPLSTSCKNPNSRFFNFQSRPRELSRREKFGDGGLYPAMSKSSKRDSDKDFLKPRNAEDAKWMELMNRHDIVGIRYLRVGQLKRKRKLNKAERKFLAEFEADRKRIMRDPDAVWKKGFDLAHRGILLLNMLLYEKGLQNFPEIRDMSAYNAMTTLWGLGVNLREDFVRYAEDGSAFAAHFIFSQGKELASAFSRLAIAYPEHFREFAERSLTMPSLRGRNPAFSCVSLSQR
jgi:hypothetical protein